MEYMHRSTWYTMKRSYRLENDFFSIEINTFFIRINVFTIIENEC